MGTKSMLADIVIERMKHGGALPQGVSHQEAVAHVLAALLARVEALESAMAAKSADYHVLRGTVSYEPKA